MGARTAMLATEHILLESDERDVPQLRSARKIHARLQVRSRLRRRAIELALIDYYYLSVRIRRPGRPVAQYVLDLRFADPKLRLSRRVAWRWMTATVVLATLAVGVASWIRASSMPWWQHDWLSVLGILSGLAVGAALVAMYRTTKTLAVFSVNGQVKLLELTGGVGSFQAIRRFTRALSAHVKIATAARRRTRGEHLRDEMREHLRLREAGVLSEQEYETSKRRILARHR
jgi:hypothetical protein